MKKVLRAALASLCIAFAPALAKGGPMQPAAIWIEPIGTIQGALYRWGYLSLGFEVPTSPGWNWMFGVGAVFAGQPGSGAEGFTQLWIFSGPAFFLGGGNTPVTGWFVSPKLLGTYSHQSYASAPGGDSGALHIGVDFGYRAVAGPFYIAPVIGLSAGPCFSCGATSASPPLHALGNPLGLRGYVELNVNLLRLGAAF